MSDFRTVPFSDSVLDASSAGSLPGGYAPAAQRPEQVGPYRILELIGEGGMGEVYKAERRHPIRQTVAVKVIKLGFDSREIVGRFESERQALAMMDHPGIAKVLDAGTTITGRPFFVMDFVAGKPITDFCDENRLSINQRLRLFGDVCDAIGHAHTKAIIHRDIKPSNVLAYMQDSKPAVKVIDFGVAKALTGGRLTDLTVNTGSGRPIGTYECMSPEQVEGSPDIDTRTDVYSLGVLLYELLTGAKPFDHATKSSGGVTDDEIKRIIREVDPPRPSTRLSSLGEGATALADRRQAKLDALARQLRGELEWIPLKAMRKERARRYTSPLQLKEDVENYLEGKPLIAGPETRSYRLQKFFKRNLRGVVTLATILLILVGGIALYIHNIRAEQRKTETALREAQKQTAIARDSSDFLANIFRNADPSKSLGADVTVVQTLKEAINKLDTGADKAEPITEATVRYVVGTTLNSLGQYEDAIPQLRRARELDRLHRSPDDPQIAITLNDLANVLSNQNKLDEAEPIAREVLRIRQSTLSHDHPDVGHGMMALGMILRHRQNFAEAETMLRGGLDIQRKALGGDDPAVATAMNNLASLLWSMGRLDEAEPLCREVLRIRRAKLPPAHPYVASSLNNLAQLFKDQKKFDDAEPLAREALELRRKTLPPDHPDTATTLHALAGILNGQGKFAEAEVFCRESLTIRRKALPADHPYVASSACDLGWLLYMQGTYAEAEPLYREALQIRRTHFGAAHSSTTKTASFLADLLDKTNRTDQARALRAQFASTQPASNPTR
jgi:serine/threonine protein kinase